MKIPFTTEQFFNVFENYNLTIFPVQIIILLLGFAGLFFLHSKETYKNKIIGISLGFLWIWIGVVYHLIFFAKINETASVFGGIFILQGILIVINTFINDKLTFTFESKLKDYIGYFFILFGLIIYPFIGYYTEGSISRTISLGLPCPSTIFTLGFFLLTNDKFPKYLLIIPTLWAILGMSAAIQFGVYQDFMLIFAALIANICLIKKKDINLYKHVKPHTRYN